MNVEGENFVVRIPGEKINILINRKNELECMKAAIKIGITPRIIYHLKPENVIVLQFIKGKSLTQGEVIRNNKIIFRIVKAIKYLHTNTNFKNSFNPFETIRKYTKFAKMYNAPLPDDFEWMTELIKDIEDAMKQNPQKNVDCHNDYSLIILSMMEKNMDN